MEKKAAHGYNKKLAERNQGKVMVDQSRAPHDSNRTSV